MKSNVPRLRLYVDEEGSTKEELLAIGERAREAKPVMRVIQALMVEGQMEQFASEGTRSGERWLADSKSWEARKKREGLDEHTEVRKGDLRDAMMAKTGGKGAIRRLSKASTTTGVRLYYAVFQGHKRRLLALTRGDQDNYASRMIEWILEGRL